MHALAYRYGGNEIDRSFQNGQDTTSADHGTCPHTMSRPRSFDPDTALANALTTFWAQGYNGSSIQVLLDAMHINRGSLYASFGSKDALFKSALDLYYARITSMVIGLLDADPSPTHGLYAVFDLTVIALPEVHRRKGCLLVNTVAELSETDPALARHAGDLLDHVHGAMKRTLQRAITCGEWQRPDAEPGAAADLLFNFMTGLRVTSRLHFDPKQIRQSVLQTLSLIGLPTRDLAP